jgi:two-component system response regulator PilR (NtrC family)
MSIPIGIPIKQPKEKLAPPTEMQLRLLLANDGLDIVQLYITEHKLPYKVVNNELVDLLEGTNLWINKFVTEDPDTVAMLEDAKKLAKCEDEILITGETGTGKELIANSMIGDRKGLFVAVNCGGLPEHLIESELFGHNKGAFTSADSKKQGLMMEATDGVLFLDEIGELPLHTQAKLLRALQEKKIRRVGSNTTEDINCKFVCATHQNIKQMVENGKFRKDLYARISTFELHIKPLREREKDIVPIIKSMKGGAEFLSWAERTGLQLHRQDYSLNVRSVQQMVKRYSVLGRI